MMAQQKPLAVLLDLFLRSRKTHSVKMIPIRQVGGQPLTLTGLFVLVTAGGCLIGAGGQGSHLKAIRNLRQFKVSRRLWLMMMR